MIPVPAAVGRNIRNAAPDRQNFLIFYLTILLLK